MILRALAACAARGRKTFVPSGRTCGTSSSIGFGSGKLSQPTTLPFASSATTDLRPSARLRCADGTLYTKKPALIGAETHVTGSVTFVRLANRASTVFVEPARTEPKATRG